MGNNIWVDMVLKSNGSFTPETGVIMSSNILSSIANLEICFEQVIQSY